MTAALHEPFASQDIYADGLDHVEALRNGNFRFVFYRETPNGREALPCALVMALPDIPEAMTLTADAIGLRFAGTFYWERPN